MCDIELVKLPVVYEISVKPPLRFQVVSVKPQIVCRKEHEPLIIDNVLTYDFLLAV